MKRMAGSILAGTYMYLASRAGRFLGILVIPRYGNKTVRVSSKFQ